MQWICGWGLGGLSGIYSPPMKYERNDDESIHCMWHGVLPVKAWTGETKECCLSKKIVKGYQHFILWSNLAFGKKPLKKYPINQIYGYFDSFHFFDFYLQSHNCWNYLILFSWTVKKKKPKKKPYHQKSFSHNTGWWVSLQIIKQVQFSRFCPTLKSIENTHTSRFNFPDFNV